jgi:AraC-like DNA-binding protein
MVKGKVRMLKTRVKAPSIKRPFSSVSDFLKGRKPGQFKKFTKDPGLALKLQTVKSGATPLSKQALLAGKEVTAVNASANQITSWLKRKKIIRKPIPGEADFPIKIKKLLEKFDTGKKLTTKEFAETNIWLQKNVAPNITLLERSLYLDPASGLRVSRLGIQPAQSATLKDILKGNFRLWERGSKPQILVFENAKIAKFPKSLNVVKRKLLAGQKLTVAETNKLIEWQVKIGSGKFKPIGSTIYSGGIELEVTLAPGELIKRIKSLYETGLVYNENEYDKLPFILSLILTNLSRKENLSIKELSLKSMKNKLLQEIILEIQNSFDTNIIKIARKLNYSENYIRRYFKKIVGISLGSYLIDIKIDKAMQYLYGSDNSIEEISEKCGYDSVTSFSKIFKKKVKLSPSKFRKNVEQNPTLFYSFQYGEDFNIN